MRALGLAVTLGILLAGCGSEAVDGDSDEAAVLAFDMDWSSPEPFNDAWRAARENPNAGVDFDFPIVSDGIEPGGQVRLYVGRSTTEGTALEAGGDVILTDDLHVSTTMLDDSGRAHFGPLEVTEGALTSGTDTIHSRYLCGTTVIAARAFRTADNAVPGSEFLAATWFYAITEPCE